MRAFYYHGVVDAEGERDYYSYNFVPVAEFRRQVAHLARVADVVSLAELTARVERRERSSARTVHISVDDGYRNNLTMAEELDRHRLPWTLFTITNALLDGYRPVYLRLADAISASNAVIGWRGGRYDLRDRTEKRRLAKAVKAELVPSSPDGQQAILAELLALPDIEEPERSRWTMLGLDQVRELQRRGVEIGCHSATHPHLTACSPAELDREVVDSADRLEAALGEPVRFFSYPDGHFDCAAVERVRTRYDAAVATSTARGPLTRWTIPRQEAGRSLPELRHTLSRRAAIRDRIAGFGRRAT